MSAVQAIPYTLHAGLCCRCQRERTLCADVVFRGKVRACVVCSQCRIASEGSWTPVEAARQEVDLLDEPRARMLGRGLRARSPSKHSMPFTF